jgi:hypothetical protein
MLRWGLMSKLDHNDAGARYQNRRRPLIIGEADRSR